VERPVAAAPAHRALARLLSAAGTLDVGEEA
jgi:hypothetical protein